ncbi:MAG TPA: preprotein translocase subunit SecA [Thermomicrobiales bacterium]|nr:preprotein translocase subunit SecA [Thermomicrobiales bacterium]
MRSFFTKLMGDPNDKELRDVEPFVEEINALEPEFEEMDDSQIQAAVRDLRHRYQEGESLDDLLVESFALTREASKRHMGQRHFDVQLIGGSVLHQGKIAEMRTGEGKTLTATLPVALNALSGEGVHVVTVNDYLAKRDTQWMGRIYYALGFTIGCLQHESAFVYDPEYETDDETMARLRPVERKLAYAADITYGTNNEYGFDYLRDNMVVEADKMVQRELNYAIVDEVDNILIDEARTPLIISGAAEQATDRYYQFAGIVRQLREGEDKDYEVDLKHKNATLTEEGIDKVERLAGIPEGESIYDERYVDLTHYLEQALTAEAVYTRDKDYIVRDGEVIIIDEFTGRMMTGRRYSEGLHQAIEAKENVKVRRQNVTMATITFQNYFRMYKKLAGMTGTAETESEEFYRIYSLPVVVIPTNKPMVREDKGDLIFKTEPGKFEAVAREIDEIRATGRPVLVGTTSIEKSEYLSQLLDRRGVDHSVLNAKQHEREAAIVAEAGKRGHVTIATNMAGRGTDIQLEPGVAELGGLHILGTERHESRRIDNQLRGRAGRQGDPGSSQFFVSLEDELMRRFGSDRVSGIMEKLGMDDDQPIEHKFISKSIESSQTKVEGHNFDRRKHVVEYDDVMNRHRETIYGDRQKIVAGVDVHEKMLELIEGAVERIVRRNTPDKSEPDYEEIIDQYKALVLPSEIEVDDIDGMTAEEIAETLHEDSEDAYQTVEERFPSDMMAKVERHVLLMVIDKLWVEHLTTMDDLRQGVGLQAYGQRDPLVVYKTEGFRLFNLLLENIQHDAVRAIFRVQPVVASQAVQTTISNAQTSTNESNEAAVSSRPVRVKKIKPNELCPCGSGKKYKHCHGAVNAKQAAPAV